MLGRQDYFGSDISILADYLGAIRPRCSFKHQVPFCQVREVEDPS